jgi:hypothetical protein
VVPTVAANGQQPVLEGGRALAPGTCPSKTWIHPVGQPVEIPKSAECRGHEQLPGYDHDQVLRLVATAVADSDDYWRRVTGLAV